MSSTFEGVPNFPDPGRFWQVVQKHKVNIFYTAPTAIRALMREGEQWPEKYDLSSLKVLGSVGEPINPEAWMWYYRNVGSNETPIVDTSRGPLNSRKRRPCKTCTARRGARVDENTANCRFSPENQVDAEIRRWARIPALRLRLKRLRKNSGVYQAQDFSRAINALKYVGL